MYARFWLRVWIVCGLAAAGCSQAQPPNTTGITPDYLLGEWCQIVEVEEDGEAPEVERHDWTFRPDGVFLRHRLHSEPLQTSWELEEDRLTIPMLGSYQLTRVSDDEFQFRRFVLNRVVRGGCAAGS